MEGYSKKIFAVLLWIPVTLLCFPLTTYFQIKVDCFVNIHADIGTMTDS